MKIRFISLSMRNFMSYGNNTTVINLETPGTTLIVGENLDDTSGGAGANGTGKTTLIQALLYAIYGKPMANITLDNLVNNINKKNMEVSVTFEKDGMFYHIVRVRKSKSYAAGNYVKFYAKKGSIAFTEEDEITRDNANTNKLIESIIGIPFELFSRIVVFSALHVPFLDLPVRHPTQACQTRIIEELFDLTSLTEKAEILKDQIKNNEIKLEMQQTRVELLKKEHERHKKQVASVQQRAESWVIQNKKQLEELNLKLKKLAGVNISEQQRAHEKLISLDKQINTTLAEQRHADAAAKALQLDIEKKEKELVHLTDQKCPYCLQKYPNADAKIQEINTALAAKRAAAEELREGIKALESEVESLTKQRSKTKANITIQNIDELIEIKGQSSSIKGRIKELENVKNPFLEPLNDLLNTELEEINYEEINTLVKIIEHQKFLRKLLTKKDSFVRKSLLDRNIPFLNSKLQQYLSELGLPHTVEFW